MKITFFLLALSAASIAREQSVSVVSFSEYRHVIRAFSPAGDITLPVARVQLEIHYPRGKQERGNMVVVYDPATGHYFWRYEPVVNPAETVSFLTEMELGTEKVYAGSEALVDFYMPSSLFEKEHTERANSLDAAESASVEEIRRGLPVFETRGYHTDAEALPVMLALGREFQCAPLSVICSDADNRIVSITREGKNWRLVLRNRFEEELILDSTFNLLSSRRLTEPKDR